MKKLSWFWQKRDYILLLLLSVGFFFASSGFNFLTQSPGYTKFLSPDETANYYFAKHYAQTGEVAVFEPANLLGEEVIHPRSIRSDNGWLKPASFLGIVIVYGKIASFIGVSFIPYLTPFFAALGIIFFYLWVRKIFGKKTAIISAFLLASFPVYFFYTTRSLFHNLLFVVWLIISAYFFSLILGKKEKIKEKFFSWPNKKKLLSFLFSFLAGIFLGLAVATRTSELLWLLPALFVLWLFYARRLGITKLVIIIAAFVLSLLPVMYWNQVLYSSPFYGGYSAMNKSLDQMSQASGQWFKSAYSGHLLDSYNGFLKTISDNVFYFGYQPRHSLQMFFHYVVLMFPWLCALAALGALFLLIRGIRFKKRSVFAYFATWFVLSSILVIYYGSWHFHDNPDPSRYTIGNSYTRYWLPIYILAIPLASYFLAYISSLIKKFFSQRIKKHKSLATVVSSAFLVLSVGAIIFVSGLFTFFGSEEGLATLYYNSLLDKANASRILAATPEDAIIVTWYHDKQLFPERKVVRALLTDNRTDEALGKLARYYPIYYYNFAFPQRDMEYLNGRKLPPFGLRIELEQRQGPFGLYRLLPVNEN